MKDLDVYAYSRAKMHARRRKTFLRDAIPVLVGVFVVALFAGLYMNVSWAKELADLLVDHWEWVFSSAVLLSAVLWVFGTSSSDDGTNG